MAFFAGIDNIGLPLWRVNSPLIMLPCRRGRVVAVEDLGQKNPEIVSDLFLGFPAPTRRATEADRGDSGRERNAVFDRGPAAARTGFYDGC